MFAAMVADIVLALHFGFVLFVVGGALLIAVGGASGWRWVRGRWFRFAHVAAIVFVAAESLLGIACPLTVLEDRLRGGAGAQSFVGRWVAHLLYYNLPEWVFTVLYIAFACLVLALWRWVPPRTPAGN